ncbi:hypothetical protein ACFVSW_14195 [Neobacillus sp. NPDC058068]|uniref:hypothetical protein n=1 Tax=Neobacillus sp. NPDC058068 TaxID=3346325 RepID=UPI0036DEDDCB
MKTDKHEIIFSKEDVQQFVQLIGDRNPIYQSAERAKAYTRRINEISSVSG